MRDHEKIVGDRGAAEPSGIYPTERKVEYAKLVGDAWERSLAAEWRGLGEVRASLDAGSGASLDASSVCTAQSWVKQGMLSPVQSGTAPLGQLPAPHGRDALPWNKWVSPEPVDGEPLTDSDLLAGGKTGNCGARPKESAASLARP